MTTCGLVRLDCFHTCSKAALKVTSFLFADLILERRHQVRPSLPAASAIGCAMSYRIAAMCSDCPEATGLDSVVHAVTRTRARSD